TEFKSLGDQSGSLSVRFATTVTKGGSIDLRIRTPLKINAGSQIAVPIIALESLGGGHRYICVPESTDSQAISWTENGVHPATLPLKLRPASAPTPSQRYYEVA